MLADTQIKKLIGEGKITITPFDEKQLGPSNYKVSLGDILLVPKAGELIDLKAADTDVPYEEVVMGEEGYILEPGDFVLGQTKELVAMDSDIGMFIDGRSTLARLGVSIHQSSTTLLPGQGDHIVTLEIFNAGKFRVKIYPNLKVGKLIFFQSTEKNSQGYKELKGQYSGQKKTTGAKIKQM